MDNIPRHKVFISYYHADDNIYKDILIGMQTYDLELEKLISIFDDYSVHEDEVDDTSMTDEQVRRTIRDNYMQAANVLILLCGQNTSTRKHIDWEIHTAMYDSEDNPKMGILVINLPSIHQLEHTCSDEERKLLNPNIKWIDANKERSAIEKAYPFLPDRIVDNLIKNNVKIPIIDWNEISNHPEKLKHFIDIAFRYKDENEYDHSRPLRDRNSN